MRELVIAEPRLYCSLFAVVLIETKVQMTAMCLVIGWTLLMHRALSYDKAGLNSWQSGDIVVLESSANSC